MFCATPLRSTVKETVYSAKAVYSTVVDVTVAKIFYSTVETVQHSMALMGHVNYPKGTTVVFKDMFAN